jgi:hypothetical protein
MTLRFAFLAAALICASAACADEAAAPVRQEEASLQSFGAAHGECREWSDGCAVCLRTDAVHCSLPGIACLPGPIACRTP